MNPLETTTPPSAARPASAPVIPKEPFALRALRGFALLGLSLVLSALILLTLLSIPVIAGALNAYVSAAQKSLVGTLAMLASFWVLPIGLIVTTWRLGLPSWRWIGGGWLAVIPVLVYLSVDDPLRRTIKLEEMAPAFPGAEKSYTVLMRYGKRNPAPEALEFEKLKLKLIGLPIGPGKPDEFVTFLQERRADIESDWAALEPQRRWLDELNRFDRIGDLGAGDVGADIIRFSVWRTLAQRASAKAGLLALDGQGDEAFATFLPVLEAARKLEPSARTQVRFLVGRVIQQMLLDTAAFALKQTRVSPAMRSRLARSLKLGVGGEAGARRLVAVDYAGAAGWVTESNLGMGYKWDRKGRLSSAAVDIFAPFIFNRNRTINLYGDLIGELQELAARRESRKIDERVMEFWIHEGRPRFKNFYGSSFMRMLMPALAKPVENYWRIEDKRLALLAQLETP